MFTTKSVARRLQRAISLKNRKQRQQPVAKKINNELQSLAQSRTCCREDSTLLFVALLLLYLGEDRTEYVYLCPKAWIQFPCSTTRPPSGPSALLFLRTGVTCLTTLELHGRPQFPFVFRLDSPTLQGCQPHALCNVCGIL